jgi:hypothetical protein
MQPRVVFLIGAPRSGSTLLARMIGSHSEVYGRGEPHLLTPLAHLGYYAKVDKAPYDPILAAEAIREFVSGLPRGEQDYVDACRAYADTLYARMLETRVAKKYFLDKTPGYALVLDFIARVYPDAKYVVLTRHPLAVFSSYAESFFDGDYGEAHRHGKLLERYVPAIAKLLRDRSVALHHVVYEELVTRPDAELRAVFEFLGLAHEPGAVEYGRREHRSPGLGDPTGVTKHVRPTTESLEKWASAVTSVPSRLELCRAMIDRLAPADLALWGHPVELLWKPLERGVSSARAPSAAKLDRYRLERKAIVGLRKRVRRSTALRRLLARVRLGADVLLRE